MNYKEIVIKDIINSQWAYLSEKRIADEYISKNILTIDRPTLIAFDFRTILDFDHYFISSFVILFNLAKDHNYLIDIIFKIHDYQIDELLWGLTTAKESHFTYSSNEKGNTIAYFIEHVGNIKLIIGEEENITFIYNSNSKSEKILDAINQKKIITSAELYQDKIIEPLEDLVHQLEELVNGRLIYEDVLKYYSIYNFIK